MPRDASRGSRQMISSVNRTLVTSSRKQAPDIIRISFATVAIVTPEAAPPAMERPHQATRAARGRTVTGRGTTINSQPGSHESPALQETTVGRLFAGVLPSPHSHCDGGLLRDREPRAGSLPFGEMCECLHGPDGRGLKGRMGSSRAMTCPSKVIPASAGTVTRSDEVDGAASANGPSSVTWPLEYSILQPREPVQLRRAGTSNPGAIFYAEKDSR
jgi:hypothetical protein